MEKQILISYEEYLQLENCKKILEDIREEQKYRSAYCDNLSRMSQSLELKMPESLKEFFKEEFEHRNISAIRFRVLD